MESLLEFQKKKKDLVKLEIKEMLKTLKTIFIFLGKKFKTAT